MENFGKTFMERPVISRINDLLGFEFNEDLKQIDIHIANQKDKPLGEKLRLLREGFRELADFLKHKSEIEKINATSWIVKEHPKLLERLGFTIVDRSLEAWHRKREYKKRLGVGSSVPEDKKDTKPGYAFISREKFVELYGKETPEVAHF